VPAFFKNSYTSNCCKQIEKGHFQQTCWFPADCVSVSWGWAPDQEVRWVNPISLPAGSPKREATHDAVEPGTIL